MRLRGFVGITLALLTGIAGSPATFGQSGLVHHWTADSTPMDAVTGVAATLRNGAGYSAGQIAQAFTFDGVDDAVDGGTLATDYPAGAFSMTLWMRPASPVGVGRRGSLFEKYEAGGAFVGGVSNSLMHIYLEGPQSAGQPTLLTGFVRDATGAGPDIGGQRLEAPAPPLDGQFHHVAFVRDVATMTLTLFVDGAVAATAALDPRVAGPLGADHAADNEDDPLTIGYGRRTTANFADPFAGQLDDVRLYHVALTGQDVAALYASGQAPTTPGAPLNLQSEVSGTDLRLRWSPPASGGTPTGYTLVARLTPGAPPVATVPVGGQTALAVSAPPGTFVITVRASNAVGSGPESAPATVVVPQPVVPPGPPTGLTAAVSGATLNLGWSAPTTGGFPTQYLLLAGTSPAFTQPIGVLPLPATATSTSIPGVPPGTYFVRMQASNVAGSGAASNEVSFTVAPPAVPGTPVLNVLVAGTTVTLSWTPSGAPATSYELRVNGLVASVGAVTTLSAPNVPSGAYRVEVRGVNASGPGPYSPFVMVVLP